MRIIADCLGIDVHDILCTMGKERLPNDNAITFYEILKQWGELSECGSATEGSAIYVNQSDSVEYGRQTHEQIEYNEEMIYLHPKSIVISEFEKNYLLTHKTNRIDNQYYSSMIIFSHKDNIKRARQLIKKIDSSFHPFKGKYVQVLFYPKLIKCDARFSIDDIVIEKEAKNEVKILKLMIEKKPEVIKRTVVFAGQAGTGKTTIISALCKYALDRGFSIFSCNEIYYVKKVYDFANEFSPALVVFEDFDSIAQKGVSDFLNILDGVEKHNVITLMTTNRIEMLDKACIREGRVNQIINVDYPCEESKRLLIDLHCKLYGLNIDNKDPIFKQILNDNTATGATISSFLLDYKQQCDVGLVAMPELTHRKYKQKNIGFKDK
jgi:ATP-dependent 26S proteasome regulatory subunit